jgi:hypothetical protein
VTTREEKGDQGEGYSKVREGNGDVDMNKTYYMYI